MRIERAFLQIYIGIILVFFVWTSINIIRFPYGVDYGEAPLMDQARRLQNQGTIYKSDLNSAPYTIANYPPLYPLLVAALNSAFHIPLFQAGRLVSFFFTLVSGAIVGSFAFHLTNNKLFAALASIVFLGNPYVVIWSSLARVDMMALAFSLMGLFILFQKKDSLIGILIASIFFIASVYTRQTYLLAAPLAGFIWLFHLNQRRSVLFLLTFGIATLLIFGTINAITQGGFYLNIMVANINRYEISRTFTMLRQLFVIWPVILIASTIVLAQILLEWLKIRRGLPSNEKYNSFLLYGLGAYSLGAIIIALTVGKVGSDVNYFLELIATCAIWITIILNRLMGQMKRRNLLIIGVIFIQLLWTLIGSIPITRNAIGNRWQELSSYNALYAQVEASTHRGIVLSDDFLDMVVLSGQPVYYQPFEYGQLYQAGLWDPANLSKQIDQKEFPLIVIGGDTINKECCWPQPMVNSIENNYSISRQSDVFIITPKK